MLKRLQSLSGRKQAAFPGNALPVASVLRLPFAKPKFTRHLHAGRFVL